jgi:hypothetical protein
VDPNGRVTIDWPPQVQKWAAKIAKAGGQTLASQTLTSP